eukprot:s1_g2500.t1
MFGGTPAELDRNALNEDMLRRLGVQILVDASGPFSCDTPDPYKVIKSCLAASAHYIDLSDDTDFTLGVSQFDNEATAKGLVVTSGASTVPSISAAAADQLTHDMKHIEFIDSTILPGNRAPRGLSVIQSIIHQAGRPFAGWSEGVVSRTIGWSKPERQTIHVSPSRSIKPRWTSLVATPDTKIFPERYGAENITVRAGLELSLMHLGLYALSFLPRIKMVQTLLPLAKLLQITANFLKPFGSDEGGMRVDVGGRRADNSVVKKSWLLHAGSGDGPFIPALPAFILCRILGSEPTKAGAGPSVGQITYPDVIASLELIDTATVTRTEECKCLFETALGKDWQRLPASLRRAHAVVRRRALRGRAKVERGASPLAWLICQIFRFPPTSKDTSVNVTFEHRGDKEIWRRTFGGSPFRSVLKAAGIETGCVEERFGLFTFQIALSVADGGLHFPVTRGRHASSRMRLDDSISR